MKILEEENKLYFDISEEQKNLENANKILEDVNNTLFSNTINKIKINK